MRLIPALKNLLGLLNIMRLCVIITTGIFSEMVLRVGAVDGCLDRERFIHGRLKVKSIQHQIDQMTLVNAAATVKVL